jgi:hypothetical protein
MKVTAFDEDGYAITGPLFDSATIAEISNAATDLESGAAGTRNLLDLAWCAALAENVHSHPAIAPYVGRSCVAVQCTYFEKSKDRNWLVALHQDLSIPVGARVEHPDLAGWSEKEGSHFVQPPNHVLEQLIAIRLHLDPCAEKDGPLRVVPGSHKFGRLTANAIPVLRERLGETSCIVEQGGALVMKPLLLHASSKARGQGRRRVLHFVFGPPVLPCELTWKINHRGDDNATV